MINFEVKGFQCSMIKCVRVTIIRIIGNVLIHLDMNEQGG